MRSIPCKYPCWPVTDRHEKALNLAQNDRLIFYMIPYHEISFRLMKEKAMESQIFGLIIFGIACLALPFALRSYLDIREQLSRA